MIDQSQLKPGDVIDNSRLCEIFQCSPQGGMRRSLRTGTLVVVSNHLKSLYHDRWLNDVFHYTGMGETGDQSLDFMQNKTLAASNTNGVEIHLFEVWQLREYTYQGIATLIESPYQERQFDRNGRSRAVWIFPLGTDREESASIDFGNYRALEENRSKVASALSDQELERLARSVSGKPGSTKTHSTQYIRNANVSQYAKRRARGICDLCRQKAPFSNKQGTPYLETHHITWLAKGGDDTLMNTVALCPNCHRRMHIRDESNDRKRLNLRIKEYEKAEMSFQ